MDLIRNNVIDIIKPEEVESLIDEGYLKDEGELIEVLNDGSSVLAHTCNARCLVPDKDGNLICRATNYQKSKINTKHVLMDLPNNYSKACLERLEKANLADLYCLPCGEIESFQSPLDYFHPKMHIPKWKHGDKTISPCETKSFCICRSMQNFQFLCGSGGSCKYCCKYCAKVDKGNFCTVSTTKDGALLRRSNFLHNTKRVTSERYQQKEREKMRSFKHPQGNVISVNQIIHHILKYPEVITNLKFIQVPTTSLETRTGKALRKPDTSNNAVQQNNYNQDEGNNRISSTNNTSPNIIPEDCGLQGKRLFNDSQVATFTDMQLNRNSVKVDMITLFSLRPPELVRIVDMVGNYLRWFHVASKRMKDSIVSELIHENIYKSAWIDGFNCQIMLRLKALTELIDWIKSIKMRMVLKKKFSLYSKSLNTLS